MTYENYFKLVSQGLEALKHEVDEAIKFTAEQSQITMEQIKKAAASKQAAQEDEAANKKSAKKGE